MPSDKQPLAESLKKLYSLAFYTIEHQATAERLARKAFIRTYRSLPGFCRPGSFGTSELSVLESLSVRRLFKYIGKTPKRARYMPEPSLDCLPAVKTARMKMFRETLSGLGAKERFIVLLFILYRYTPARICDIIRTPFFSPKKKVRSALCEAAANQIRNRQAC